MFAELGAGSIATDPVALACVELREIGTCAVLRSNCYKAPSVTTTIFRRDLFLLRKFIINNSK